MLANLNDVLRPAMRGRYAIGLFNAVNVEMARGIIEAAEALRAPVIVGTAEVLLPIMPLEAVADYLVPMAKRASVPVVLHFDHGLRHETCVRALDLGFTSVMYDCSTDSYDENLRRVKDMAAIAHARGATIEGELGHVGDNEGSAEGDSHITDPAAFYTDPAQAVDFTRRTSVDALAIAVGSAHGAYKLPPKLDFARIRAIAEATNLPLVLHGGSGLSASDFRTAVEKGICKINIFTDINVAAVEGMQAALPSAAHGITDLIPAQIAAVRRVTEDKMQLFGSNGKA